MAFQFAQCNDSFHTLYKTAECYIFHIFLISHTKIENKFEFLNLSKNLSKIFESLKKLSIVVCVVLRYKLTLKFIESLISSYQILPQNI